MSRNEVISFLSTKTGYLKKSAKYLANMLKTDENTVKEAIRTVKINRPLESVIPDVEYKFQYNIEGINFNKTDLEEFSRFIKSKNKSVPETKEVKAPEPFKSGIHLISGCNHIPFHNQKMLDGMLKLIEDLGSKLSGLHFLGDFLDLNSLSAHDRGQIAIPGITLGKEYREGNKVLDLFDKAIGNNTIDKTFIYGNHEDRYLRHIKDIDNSKFADALTSPKDALKLEERGYAVYTKWREDYHQLGNHLQLIHGEYCSKSPARAHMDKLKSSVMFAHTHRVDIVYDGEKAGFNIGWGGDKNAPAFNYVSRITKMNWINGFALVTIDEEGYFHTQVITVYNDTFWYNGKKY